MSIVWSGRVALGDESFRIVWPGTGQEPSRHTAAYRHLVEAPKRMKKQTKQHKNNRKWGWIWPISFSRFILHWVCRTKRMVGVNFIPWKDGRANSFRAFRLLIVHSVNAVNLINFRAGSHMTFSSIFSPTSKTSISSSKIGRSEWQSPITLTYLKPRVNLFSSFWMCSLQFAVSKKTSK